MNHTSALPFFTRNCTSPKPPLLISCVNSRKRRFDCQRKELSIPFQHHPWDLKIFIGINFFDRPYWHVQKEDLVQTSQKLCFLDPLLYSLFKQSQQLIGAWVWTFKFFYIKRSRCTFKGPLTCNEFVLVPQRLYMRSGWTSRTIFQMLRAKQALGKEPREGGEPHQGDGSFGGWWRRWLHTACGICPQEGQASGEHAPPGDSSCS